MINIVVMGAGAYLALVAALYVFQRSLLYLPDTAVPSLAASGLAEMRTATLETADGLRLLAWYRPARPGQPSVVYFHGNGGHIGYRTDKVRPFLEAGLGVLLVSYRGYGGNPGAPSETGLYADGRAALSFLERSGVGGGSLVLYGESLGSGVAVRLAVERLKAGNPVGAVVLESPFTSIPDVAAVHYPWAPVRLLAKDRFEIKDAIAEIGAPLLVVHGTADRVVPVHFGRELFARAAAPKEAAWLEGADHNDLHRYGLAQRVLSFLARAGLARGTSGEVR